jgi:hypothetical protein
MTASCGAMGSLVMRMQGDLLETPGLTLTRRGAHHRFGVDEVTCEAVLTALVDAGVLTRTQEGASTRLFPATGPAGSRAERAWPEARWDPSIRRTRRLHAVAPATARAGILQRLVPEVRHASP